MADRGFAELEGPRQFGLLIDPRLHAVGEPFARRPTDKKRDRMRPPGQGAPAQAMLIHHAGFVPGINRHVVVGDLMLLLFGADLFPGVEPAEINQPAVAGPEALRWGLGFGVWGPNLSGFPGADHI